MAKENGLNFVYVGNVPGSSYENTYCPKCGTELIKRYGFEVIKWNLDQDNRCPKCGYKVPIVGKFYGESLEERFHSIPL